jgi:hypothetical protein
MLLWHPSHDALGPLTSLAGFDEAGVDQSESGAFDSTMACASEPVSLVHVHARGEGTPRPDVFSLHQLQV